MAAMETTPATDPIGNSMRGSTRWSRTQSGGRRNRGVNPTIGMPSRGIPAVRCGRPSPSRGSPEDRGADPVIRREAKVCPHWLQPKCQASDSGQDCRGSRFGSLPGPEILWVNKRESEHKNDPSPIVPAVRHSFILLTVKPAGPPPVPSGLSAAASPPVRWSAGFRAPTCGSRTGSCP